MRWYVDGWQPSYGTSLDMDDEGPGEYTAAAVDAEFELPADEWRPLVPPPDAVAPDVVYVVDGVRRIDARVWLDDDVTYPGIAASYAAGAVRCDRGAGVADVVTVQIERGIFTPAPDMMPVGVPPARYEPHIVAVRGPNDLVNGVQAQLRAVEERVSEAVTRDGDLLIVDGPLRGRVHLANTVGYVKTHSRQYLPDRLVAVVTGLHSGQRSPIFTIQSKWPLHSWYVRLPGPTTHAWAGIARVECSGDLGADAATALADLSSVTLPGLASTPHKDPRAPQNLVPISGLERRLRASLGDPRLLHRMLVRNAAAAGTPA